MSALRLLVRAELRHRWRSWLTLVVLIALVGGLVLAALAAGRRTASAFPRFLEAHGFDALVFNQVPLPQLATLPTVASLTTLPEPGYGTMTCSCHHTINQNNLSYGELAPQDVGRIAKVVSGRLPRAPDELLASSNMEQDSGIHIGDVIDMHFFAVAQTQATINSATPVEPAGPTVAFHVVGIEVSEPEFPTGNGESDDLFGGPGLPRSVPIFGYEYLIRLRHGAQDISKFNAELNALHPEFEQGEQAVAEAVTASIHPQAVGWWVLALLAGVAGVAVIGQALGRQSVVESAEYPTLASLGVPRGQLLGLGMARNLFVAVAGAVGAAIVAFALSAVAPVGEARLAEPSTGLAFDPLVLLAGAGALVLVVLGLGVWPAVRAAQARVVDERATRSRPSSIVARLAAWGAPPSVVVGVRHALERGRGAASVPVGTALLGTVLAVTALVGTAVFGASLTHLTATPALYGDNYQILISNLGGVGSASAEVARMRRDPGITGLMVGTRQEVSIDGTPVFAVLGQSIRGPLLLSSVTGRLPAGDGQIDLGNSTMRAVGAHLGSTVHVTMQTPGGGTRTASFTTVGTVSFPGQFGLGSLGDGAAFELAGFVDALCPPGPTSASCRTAFQSQNTLAVLAQAAPGPKSASDIDRYVRLYQNDGAKGPEVPTSLVNFGQAVNFPLILGLMLTLFGAATLANLLVVSLTRRRREMGLLKALGFLRGQVGASVCWQATTLGVVGVVVGVPLGVALGQTVWRAFAVNLGAVPISAVPVAIVIILALGVVVAANVLAVLPALVASRSEPAQLLRST